MRITLIGIDYISKIYCPDPHISVIFKQDTNLRPETMTPVYNSALSVLSDRNPSTKVIL